MVGTSLGRGKWRLNTTVGKNTTPSQPTGKSTVPQTKTAKEASPQSTALSHNNKRVGKKRGKASKPFPRQKNGHEQVSPQVFQRKERNSPPPKFHPGCYRSGPQVGSHFPECVLGLAQGPGGDKSALCLSFCAWPSHTYIHHNRRGLSCCWCALLVLLVLLSWLLSAPGVLGDSLGSWSLSLSEFVIE